VFKKQNNYYAQLSKEESQAKKEQQCIAIKKCQEIIDKMSEKSSHLLVKSRSLQEGGGAK
jgi:hypothetical protein